MLVSIPIDLVRELAKLTEHQRAEIFSELSLKHFCLSCGYHHKGRGCSCENDD